MKTASTREIIEYLEAYEKINGIGAVESIGTVGNGDRKIEYFFILKTKMEMKQEFKFLL